ncbi:hypothetical protein [Dokdonella immobilis]|uniref:L-serine dehydratase n=1 Tax=Dokdonella immobilis TaxID=578942 RepID=A0A1I4VIU6_9GAMM|nr:L-serine dehydratase [Dokdonella immobilis]
MRSTPHAWPWGGHDKHRVSFDKVIKTKRDTGRDMQDKRKETSHDGLAVNIIER